MGTADSRGLLNSVKNQIGAHDAAGNAVLPAGAYDFDNRLTAWGNERYGYDASNKRVVRTSVAVDSDKHVTFWVGSYKMGEYRYGWNGGWNLTAVSEWGMIGGRVVKPSDRLGSDISGGRTYLPYGEELNPSPGGRYKFATYWRDETGLDYADQRYYSPGSGRFLSADPYMASGGTAEPGSWNRYAYVIGDPINLHDPAGLDYKIPVGGAFNPLNPGNVAAGQTSVTVTASPLPLVPSNIAIYSDYTNPWWQQEQDARENNCTTVDGRNCWEVDRERAEAERLRQQQENTRAEAQEIVGHCIAKAFGVETLLGAGAVALGLPTVPKPFVTPGSSQATSLASSYLSQWIKLQLPFRVWAPTITNPFSGTVGVGRLLGRWTPVVGQVLPLNDALEATKCVKEAAENIMTNVP